MKRKDRHEKLMDARVEMQTMVKFRLRHQTPDGALIALTEAVDYLFFAVDLLMREVEELKAIVSGKKGSNGYPTAPKVSILKCVDNGIGYDGEEIRRDGVKP